MERAGQEAEHSLLRKAPCEGPNRFGMAAGFLRPLGGGAVLKEHQRPNHLVAPLNQVAKVFLETVKLQLWLHPGFLPCWSPRTGGLGSSYSPGARQVTRSSEGSVSTAIACQAVVGDWLSRGLLL